MWCHILQGMVQVREWEVMVGHVQLQTLHHASMNIARQIWLPACAQAEEERLARIAAREQARLDAAAARAARRQAALAAGEEYESSEDELLDDDGKSEGDAGDGAGQADGDAEVENGQPDGEAGSSSMRQRQQQEAEVLTGLRGALAGALDWGELALAARTVAMGPAAGPGGAEGGEELHDLHAQRVAFEAVADAAEAHASHAISFKSSAHHVAPGQHDSMGHAHLGLGKHGGGAMGGVGGTSGKGTSRRQPLGRGSRFTSRRSVMRSKSHISFSHSRRTSHSGSVAGTAHDSMCWDDGASEDTRAQRALDAGLLKEDPATVSRCSCCGRRSD